MAQTIAGALVQNSSVSQYVGHFAMRTRSSASDRHSAKTLAERIIARSRRGWSHSHFICELHVVAGFLDTGACKGIPLGAGCTRDKEGGMFFERGVVAAMICVPSMI